MGSGGKKSKKKKKQSEPVAASIGSDLDKVAKPLHREREGGGMSTVRRLSILTSTGRTTPEVSRFLCMDNPLRLADHCGMDERSQIPYASIAKRGGRCGSTFQNLR